MSTTTSVVATGVIVVAGRIAQEKPIDIKIAVGAAAFALSLSLIGNANEQLASRFAALVLVGAALIYVPAIASKTGLGSGMLVTNKQVITKGPRL